MRKRPIIGVALAATAALVLFAGVPVSRLLPWLLVLACPLMMLFMHRGGHGDRHSHGASHTESRHDLTHHQAVGTVGSIDRPLEGGVRQ